LAKKIHLISLASNIFPELKPLMEMYQKRMRLMSFDYHVMDLPPHLFSEQHVLLQKKIDTLAKGQNKIVILLREQGKELNSQEFSSYVMTFLNQAMTIFFVIGAHQGFSTESLGQYKNGLSLSQLTFPHQIVPLIFAEQLYRTETLVENKPYHY
jgi:23S rRNA (pseudouridine1915-N3)-methyltransferase